jgi:hypothetical protein
MSAPLDPSRFAAAKLNLVLGAGLDPKLPKLAMRIVAVFVGRHMNADRGGEAWPSVKTLCAELCVSSGSMVREALYALLKRGHLVAERQRGETTHYRIADRYFEDAPQPAGQATLGRGEPAYQAGGEPAYQAGGEPAYQAGGEPAYQAGGEPARQATNTGNRSPGIEHREMNTGKRDSPPSKIDLFAGEEDGRARKPRRVSPSPADESFESFWSAYPRHVAKASAKKAFERAVKDGARPEEITLGAMRFAAERERAEPDPATRERFTPHPATWLNAGRWKDAPAAAQPPMPGDFRNASAPPQRPSKRPSALELAMSMNAADEESRRR